MIIHGYWMANPMVTRLIIINPSRRVGGLFHHQMDGYRTTMINQCA
jgi:hypothetical protein